MILARSTAASWCQDPRTKLRWATIVWILFTAFSGGGISGYFKSNVPILGPWMRGLQAVAANWIGHDNPLDAPARHGQTSPAAPPAASSAPLVPAQLASARRPSDRLLIASFNIQVFGVSKMAKPHVVQVLAQVVRQFDIVAIQEILAKSDEVMPEFLRAINADGSRYDFLISPRLGRTVSTEQYAFVYDTQRVEHDPYAVGVMSDPNDMLHREPFVARFRARTPSPTHAFTFWLVNTHTDPDEVPEEVAALTEVFRVMQTARPDEDDVIPLSDLNAGETQLGPLGQIPGITWAIRGAMTNTRQN